MSARARILRRLRDAPPSKEVPLPDVAGWFAAHARGEDLARRIARLRYALEGAHAEVHDTTATEWPALLLKIAAAKGVRTLLIGTDCAHGTTLQTMPVVGLQLVPYASAIESWRATLFDGIDAGLTLAKSAIAESGSLILWPDASEPRLLSLVPPLHFVLLDTASIHADFHSALGAENWKDGLPANALLISGPSKTADIQQTLAYGAHGPRELIVLLRHPQGGAA